LKGIVSRIELEASIFECRPAKIEPAVTCRPGEIIREMQNRFIDASTGFIVVSDNPGGRILGVVTLHDVLRAQVSMSERENAE